MSLGGQTASRTSWGIYGLLTHGLWGGAPLILLVLLKMNHALVISSYSRTPTSAHRFHGLCKGVGTSRGMLSCAESPEDVGNDVEIDVMETQVKAHVVEEHPSVAWLKAPSMNPGKFNLTASPRRTLGVDYGTIRVGLAVSIGLSPRALIGISNQGSDDQVAKQVVLRARAEGVTDIVVGLPLERNGTETGMCVKVRNFTSVLANEAGKMIRDSKIFLFDERFSSKQAKAMQSRHGGQISPKLEIDSVAACLILEHYFAEQCIGAERVHPTEGAIFSEPPTDHSYRGLMSAGETIREFGEARAESLRQAAADFVPVLRPPKKRKKGRKR
ncbi:unnamed protein product [Discosporangium mesarthrocarpum]